MHDAGRYCGRCSSRGGASDGPSLAWPCVIIWPFPKEQSLKFVQEKAIGANKPVYDFSCSFMCQPLNAIDKLRKSFFEHFNDECVL